MSLHIYCFGSDFPPTGGGISTYTHEWLKALAGEKDIKVKTTIFGNKEPRITNIGSIEIKIVRSVNFFYVGYRILVDTLRHYNYDVFHSFNLFPVGFWTVFWAKVIRKKSVVSFYGADACDKRTSKKVVWLQRWLLKHSTYLITITQFTKNEVVKRYNLKEKHINVIHPIIPEIDASSLEDIRHKFGFTTGDFVILSVSRLVKRKGIQYLIKAISEIKDKTIKLMIVGGGPEREYLENLAQELGVTDRVVFFGKVPKLAEYYHASDVVSLVSYVIQEEGDFEGLGLVLLEAQSYGKPVIGTQSGGIPEAFDNGRTGILVPEKNVNELIKAILKLKDNKKWFVSARQYMPVFLESQFGRDHTIKKYLQLFYKS